MKIAALFIIAVTSVSTPLTNDYKWEAEEKFPADLESCKSVFIQRSKTPNCRDTLDGFANYEIHDGKNVIGKYSIDPCKSEYHLESTKPVSQKEFCEALVTKNKSTPLKYRWHGCC